MKTLMFHAWAFSLSCGKGSLEPLQAGKEIIPRFYLINTEA
jgi:hypothetical protein